MKIDSSATSYIMALYWGSDAPFSADDVSYTRDFEIVVDDTVIGEATLNKNDPENLIYSYYEILLFQVVTDTALGQQVLGI